MRLSLKPTPEELVLLSMESISQSSNYKNMIRRKMVLLTFVFTALAFSFYLTSSSLLIPLAIIVASLVLLPLYPWLQKCTFRRHFKKLYTAPENAFYLEKQTLDLNKSGITAENSKLKIFYTWSSVLKLFEDTNHFIIFVEGNRGWLVPKKIFKKGELSEFKKWFKWIS